MKVSGIKMNALEAAFSKCSHVTFIGTGKKKLFEALSQTFSNDKMVLCNNSDQT